MRNEELTCGHFVNPFTDIGFKIIFGQPASKELLITLLNELLAGEHQIENLTLLDKENHSDSIADAGIISASGAGHAVSFGLKILELISGNDAAQKIAQAIML